MKTRESQLAINTIIYAIGNLGSKLLSFILLPMYTFYLSDKQYGNYDLINTTIMLLEPIITIKLVDGVYRWLLDSEDQLERVRIINIGLKTILKNLLLVNMGYLLIIQVIDIKYGVLSIIYLNFRVLNGYITQCIRGMKLNREFAISGVIYTLVMLLSNVFFITKIELKVEGLLISCILANFISTIYAVYKSKYYRYIDLRVKDKVLLRSIIIYSIPLIPSAINWWIMKASDRYILSYFIGLDANGIYAVSNMFPTILMTINNIFYMAWQESSIIEYNSEDRNEFYTKMFDGLIKFEFSMLIGLISVTYPLMKIFIDESFQEAWIYTFPLYIGAVFYCFASFYATGYLSVKNTKGAFRTSLIGAIINIVVNLLLIKKIGIHAASISTAFGFLAMWITRIIETKKYFKIDINWKMFFIYSFLTIIYILGALTTNIYIIIIEIIVAIIIALISNKEIIKNFIEKFDWRFKNAK